MILIQVIAAIATSDDGILSIIHLQDLIARGCRLRHLVRADAFEPRKPQTDAPPNLAGLVDPALVRRRFGEVGRLDLPHLHGVEPHVARQRVGYVVLGALLRDGVLVEQCGKLFQVLVEDSGRGGDFLGYEKSKSH